MSYGERTAQSMAASSRRNTMEGPPIRYSTSEGEEMGQFGGRNTMSEMAELPPTFAGQDESAPPIPTSPSTQSHHQAPEPPPSMSRAPDPGGYARSDARVTMDTFRCLDEDTPITEA